MSKLEVVTVNEELYDETLECLATDKAITEAELTAQNNVLYDAREALAKLRERYFSDID